MTATVSHARALRRRMTDAETHLWRALRAQQLCGAKFRRQVPFGPYILDFACHAARLVIEVDGGQHAESASDIKRDRYIEASGYRVLRFWNNDVLANLDGVLETVRTVLVERSPPPQPSPIKGEGGMDDKTSQPASPPPSRGRARVGGSMRMFPAEEGTQ